MDLSAIIVVGVLTAGALAAIVGMEIYSRKAQPKEASADQNGSVTKSSNHPGPGL